MTTEALMLAAEDSTSEPQPGLAGEFELDLTSFRKQVTASPIIPYEVLFPTDAWRPDTKVAADGIVGGEWRDMHFAPVDMRPPVAWDQLGSKDRIREFRIQSWHAMGPVLAAYDNTGDESYLQFALDLALDWVRHHETSSTASPFAWYDMATGLRAYRLAYLTDRAARSEQVSDQDVATLVASVLVHAAALADESRFAAHSNHGFFVAAGQLAMSRRLPFLPGMPEAADQARGRLDALLETQFSAEGVHREHSCEYHLMVWQALQGLLEGGLLAGEPLRALSDRIQEALAWFILPNGTLVTFGDSSTRVIEDLDSVSNAALRFAATQGREGEAPAATVRAFSASGYVVVRDGWAIGDPQADGSSYLAQTCAFHSRVHKHADDLSFVWYDRGHELLIDPGKFGYVGRTEPDSALAKAGFWYSDPNRVYVESTRAHNTVEIDGESYPRRDVEPYGSALGRVGTRDGVTFTECEVTHLQSVRHARVLLFRPGEWLIVFDWLNDRARRQHRFTQRFHFSPELALAPSDGADRATFVVPGVAEPLQMVSLLGGGPCAVVAGQRAPHLLGWISRQEGLMEPCWTAAFSQTGAAHATFATLFSFGREPILTASPAWTGSKANVDGRKALLRWQQGRYVCTAQFARAERGAFELEFRAVQAKG